MSSKVVTYNVSAPKKTDHIPARVFCEDTLVPEYRKYRSENPAAVKVKMDVTVDSTTEQSLYFIEVNKVLRTMCPELIVNYTISRRRK